MIWFHLNPQRQCQIILKVLLKNSSYIHVLGYGMRFSCHSTEGLKSTIKDSASRKFDGTWGCFLQSLDMSSYGSIFPYENGKKLNFTDPMVYCQV